jgi:hypothetical protein
MTKEKTKFNFIDIMIAAAILLVIVVGAWFFINTRGGEQAYVYFTVEIRENMPNFAETIIIGGEVRDSIRNFTLGEVVSVRSEPAISYSFNNETNEFFIETFDNRYDVYVTIRGPAKVTDSEISIEGQPVRVGRQMFLRGNGFAGMGFVTALEVR